ncbi:response regulator transcription factor [Pseudoxanthomonas sp. LH2527]|uniref:response regulator n=1 Tax=Pseudoxanthomonas sp. LH2527 TaxID=2923249 RepID=UPI001F13CDA8|nr:response regulator transcription factor [Pseudoxanthomonas sp. LH2527]MCH6482146.1 response regulator transcription factor [Pseudoxanthomonas sp. LH2527]
MSEVSSRIRIIVVDDHPLLRAGIAAVVNAEPDMVLVGEATRGDEAVTLFRSMHPDITLMDLQMPGMSGLDAIREIRSGTPSACIMVLTTYPGDAQASGALKAGAAGFLLKSSVRKDLLQAIRVVHSGRRFVPADAAIQIAENLLDESLSQRELEVLQCVAQGMANKVVAGKLGIAEETVKAHMRNIMEKLSVHDRTHAVTKALKSGIIR